MRIPVALVTATSLSLSLSLSGLEADKTLTERGGDDDGAKTIWATPHDSYSSSIGVLGCKVDTNRVAYWPQSVDCSNICVSVEYQDRQVYLLRIDQSGGAYDMSYDAWNYLYTGKSATESPATGGTVAMTYTNVDASKCRSLIHTEGNKLPLSAANSMNYLASCLAQPKSWVASNYMTLNIADSICTLGIDEQCKLKEEAGGANQPTCPHTLGDMASLKDRPVWNIQYGSGNKVLATSGASGAPGAGGNGENKAALPGARPRLVLLLSLVLCGIYVM